MNFEVPASNGGGCHAVDSYVVAFSGACEVDVPVLVVGNGTVCAVSNVIARTLAIVGAYLNQGPVGSVPVRCVPVAICCRVNGKVGSVDVKEMLTDASGGVSIACVVPCGG